MSAFSHTLLLSISRVKELPLGRFKTTLFPLVLMPYASFCAIYCAAAYLPLAFVILNIYALIHCWGMHWEPDHSTSMQTFL